MGTTHKSYSVSVKMFLLEHLLYCKLQCGGRVCCSQLPGQLSGAHPNGIPSSLSRSPSPCYLDILHILVAHVAGKREDAVLAKTRRATVIHWKSERNQTRWLSDISRLLDTLSTHL